MPQIFCRTYKAEFQPGYQAIPTPGLVRAIQQLPTTYDYTAYVKFIENWGTHYVWSVEMGGRYNSCKRQQEENRACSYKTPPCSAASHL
jgi:hypothetical protein